MANVTERSEVSGESELNKWLKQNRLLHMRDKIGTNVILQDLVDLALACSIQELKLNSLYYLHVHAFKKKQS